jgi:hypothetical protein
MPDDPQDAGAGPEHFTFEWSAQILPDATMSKLPGPDLAYVILPHPSREGTRHECLSAVLSSERRAARLRLSWT